MRQTRRAVLVGPIAPRLSSPALKLTSRDLLIGVDGGAALLLKKGYEPHLCIGDWDSVSSREKKLILEWQRHLSLHHEKDRSDFHYALQAALHLGATRIAATGFAGGRPDHHLAALLDLAELACESGGLSEPPRLIAEDAEYRFVSARTGAFETRLRRGQIVSVFALGGAARGVTLTGFRFEMRGHELSPSSHGLSNEARGGAVRISLEAGCLAVVLTR